MISEKSSDFLKRIIYSNSPWIKDANKTIQPETYKREAFYRIKKELHATHGNAVLIKGPIDITPKKVTSVINYSHETL